MVATNETHDAFVAAMATPPEDSTLRQFRGSRVLAQYHLGKALAAYDQVPPRSETFLQLASLCWFDDKIDQLEQLVDLHAKHQPGDIDLLQWQCRLQIKKGDTAKAIALFNQAIAKADPQVKKPQLVATFLNDMVDAGKALEAYAAVPDPAATFQTLAWDLRDQGRHAEIPALIEAHRQRVPGDPWLDYHAGECLLDKKDFEKAANKLYAAWSNAPADVRLGMRFQTVYAMYMAGKATEAYSRIEPKKESYLQLVQLLAKDKKPLEMLKLIAAHRPHAKDDPDLVFHEARTMALLKQSKLAIKLVDQAYRQQHQVYLRDQYVRTLANDLATVGSPLEAYRALPDQKLAFQALSRRFLAAKDDKQLAELIVEHAKTNPGDPWLAVYRGEQHMARGEWTAADDCLTAVLAKASNRDNWYWQSRTTWLRCRVASGKTVATYQELGANIRAFQDLNQACLVQKNGDQLRMLLDAHRMAWPDVASLAQAELDILWLTKDYEGILKRIQDDPEQELSRPQNKWKADSYRIRTLVHLKKTDEAVIEAQAIAKHKSGSRVLLVLAHAARATCSASRSCHQRPTRPIPCGRLLSRRRLGADIARGSLPHLPRAFPEPPAGVEPWQ